MYEDLVKRLDAYSAEHEYHGGITAEAADAIEEMSREYESIAKSLTESVELVRKLQQTVEHYKGCSDDWYKEACDYKAMLPRWISVTERLPENDGRYLVCNQPYKAQWVMIQEYWKDSGWSGSSVTHWMPLPPAPELPEEEA